jgi:hypothetical protein
MIEGRIDARPCDLEEAIVLREHPVGIPEGKG